MIFGIEKFTEKNTLIYKAFVLAGTKLFSDMFGDVGIAITMALRDSLNENPTSSILFSDIAYEKIIYKNKELEIYAIHGVLHDVIVELNKYPNQDKKQLITTVINFGKSKVFTPLVVEEYLTSITKRLTDDGIVNTL